MLITKDISGELSQKAEIHIMPGVQLSGSGTVAAPSFVYAGNGSFWNSSWGGYTYFCPPFEINLTTVGNYTSVAKNCIIAVGHPTNLLTTSPVAWRPWLPNCEFPGKIDYQYRNTVIGSDVWIGANVTIKAGVTIGDGCIIGAGSIVTRDIPEYSVAVGNPCRVIRQRFEDKITKVVRKTRWFDYDWRSTDVDWRTFTSAYSKASGTR